MLDCEIITQDQALEALAAEWRQLHARVGRNPQYDYDAFMIWWRVLGNTFGNRQLHVVVGRENGKLVGILPLAVVKRKGLRILQEAGHKVIHYCDVICENETQAAELWAAARHSPHYHFAIIRDVYSGTDCYRVLSSFAHRRDILASYSLQVKWKSGKEWLAELPGRTRRDHVRYMRRLEDKAPVLCEIGRSSPLPADIIEKMVAQKVAWAKARGMHGMFAHPGVLDYFKQLLHCMAQTDRLFLTWLKCGEDTIAYFLWFVFKGTLWGHIVTYDPEWSYYSPGNVILAHSIEWGIDQGLDHIHIGNGDTLEKGASYKAKFSNDIGECVAFSFSGSILGRLMEFMFYNLRRLYRFVKSMQEKIHKKVKVEDGVKNISAP